MWCNVLHVICVKLHISISVSGTASSLPSRELRQCVEIGIPAYKSSVCQISGIRRSGSRCQSLCCSAPNFKSTTCTTCRIGVKIGILVNSICQFLMSLGTDVSGRNNIKSRGSLTNICPDCIDRLLTIHSAEHEIVNQDRIEGHLENHVSKDWSVQLVTETLTHAG